MERNDAPIAYRADRAVATITLDDPARRNALSTRMLDRLREAIARAVADEAIRTIVIDHAGPVFCAGADLTESAGADSAEDLPAVRLAEALADMCEAPKPVVALVRGPARGGGMGLLAAADVTLCESETVMAFSEVRLGVVPAVIGPVVARRLSPGKMRQLFITGDPFTAEQALDWGLVDGADTAGAFDDLIESLRRGGPLAQAGVKALTATPDLRERLREAAALTAEYFFSDEGREGVRSFIEKRSPSWVD